MKTIKKIILIIVIVVICISIGVPLLISGLFFLGDFKTNLIDKI